MSEITLADLMNSRDTAAPAPSPVSAEELSREITLLSPEDRALADEIKSQIDVRDSQMLMQYGSGAKQDIADFSGHILGSIRTKDSGYAGQLMTDLVTNVESLDYDDLEKDPGIFGLFQKAGAKVRRFLAQYQKLEVNVDRIEGKLEEARMQMLKDIGMFDSLYELLPQTPGLYHRRRGKAGRTQRKDDPIPSRGGAAERRPYARTACPRL